MALTSGFGRPLRRLRIFFLIAAIYYFLTVIMDLSLTGDRTQSAVSFDFIPNPLNPIRSSHSSSSLSASSSHIPQRAPRYKFSIARDIGNKAPKGIPRIQARNFKALNDEEIEKNEQRLKAVKDAFIYSWKGYKNNAMGHDELSPLSAGTKDSYAGWAATLVDSLDSLLIFGLTDEFEQALPYIKSLDYTKSTIDDVSVFETNIRQLGGLISAFQLSGSKHNILKQKAVEVGDVLLHAFMTDNGMPYKSLSYGVEQRDKRLSTTTADIGTFSLEFSMLSQITGDRKYFEAAQRITNALHKLSDSVVPRGLLPTILDASNHKKSDKIVAAPKIPTKRQFSKRSADKENLQKASIKVVSQPIYCSNF